MDIWQLLPQNTIPFLVASLLIELTPGPNMTYLALVAARDGRRAGFQTLLGIALGLSALGAVAAFGATEIILSSSFIYEGLRWAGVGFLLYLSWEGWTKSADTVLQPSDEFNRYFTRGLITNLLNPKAAMFYISVLPTFIVTNNIAQQAFVLTAIYVAVATGVHFFIVILAGSFQSFLHQPNREKWARRTLSTLLAVVALWFAWATQLPV
jgi:threonine/homoserine/homoserine lactone efflux protein